MNEIMAANTVSLLCIIAAFVLAWKKREGWGWFLFIAVLCEVVPGAK